MNVSFITNSADFDRTIEEMKESYHNMEKSCEDAYKKLREWNKDEEIQKLRDEISELRKNSLLMLSDSERDAIQDFKRKHYDMHSEQYQKGAGSTYIYRISGTGFGHCITIECPLCHGLLDATDTSVW